MNKTQVIDVVALKTGMKKKDAESAVNAFLSTVEEALIAGDKVQLVGFGTFETKERGERIGRNPATNETMTIPATKHASFSIGRALKEKINNG